MLAFWPLFLLALLLGAIAAFLSMRRWWLRRTLVRVARALARTPGAVWWVDFGTLLGIVREGDIIADDNDVDVCLLEANRAQGDRLLADFRDALRREAPTLRVNARVQEQITRVHPPNIHWLFVDLYHVRPKGEWLRGATGATSDVRAALVLPTRCHWWARGGVHLQLPATPEPMLVWRYGPDWRTPRRGDRGRAG